MNEDNEEYKSLLTVNESNAKVTLSIYRKWLPIPVISKIIHPNEKYLHREKKIFRFKLVANFDNEREKKEFPGPLEWVTDTLIKVTESLECIKENLADYPQEKRICLRKMHSENGEMSASGKVNLYSILGLDMTEVRKLKIDEQKEIIKKAFIKQIRIWHPDRDYGDVEIAMQIVMAQETLLDDERRARYHNEADYDKGWFSLKRCKAIFCPDCYTEVQKEAYCRRMGLTVTSLALAVGGIVLTVLTAGAAAPSTVLCGAVFGGGLSGAGILSGMHAITKDSVVHGCDLKPWLLKAVVGLVGDAFTVGGAAADIRGVVGIGRKMKKRTAEERQKATFCCESEVVSLVNVKSADPTKSWIWEKKSEIHREKFNKLHEYGRTRPQEIKEINDVRVCFSKAFLLGKGSDATRVFVGLSRDGYERAVKRLPRDDCASLAEQEKKILNEPNAVQSKYVVKYRYLDDKSDKDWVFLMMDLCEETLNEYVERSSWENWTKIARIIIQQVLKGLRDLHSCRPTSILHRDLKPSNILRNVHGKWLIADFGISRILTQNVSTHRSSSKGTKGWKAVETYPSKDESEVRYKRESDIQVAGMVAFYIVTKGEHPFGDEPDRQRNLLDGNPVYLDKLEDPAAKDLISWMLKHDPEDRPTAKEALKHPYLLSMKEKFELLCKMGNQLEIKTGDKSSDVVTELNNDPTDWKALMRPDVLNYLCTNFVSGKLFSYDSWWTECLRLIRNVNQHWNDQPRPLPQPEAFYVVGDPQEYFLKIFPDLPVVVHRIVRSCDWKERPDFEEFFGTVKRE